MFQSLEESLKQNRLRWMGHILCMPTGQLFHCLTSSKANIDWKMSRGGQLMTWLTGMKLMDQLEQVQSDYELRSTKSPEALIGNNIWHCSGPKLVTFL